MFSRLILLLALCVLCDVWAKKCPKKKPSHENDKPQEKKPEEKPRTDTYKGDTSKQYECAEGKLTPEQRKVFVDDHNKLRSELAKGELKDSKGNPMPGAKNMMQVSWNCIIELQAQKWADHCVFEHSTTKVNHGVGENIYAVWPGNKENFDKTPLNAPNDWWSELKHYYNIKTNPTNKLSIEVFNLGVGHWTQMAWASTFQIGCGVAACNNETWIFAVCQYWTPGNYLGEKIYEFGNACRNDNDCSSNKCNTANGLCIEVNGQKFNP